LLRWESQYLKFPVVFKSAKEKQNKFKEKQEFLLKIDFGFWLSLKQMTVDTCNFD